MEFKSPVRSYAVTVLRTQAESTDFENMSVYLNAMAGVTTPMRDNSAARHHTTFSVCIR